MKRRHKTLLATLATTTLLAVAIALTILLIRPPTPAAPSTLVGDVLQQNNDPALQTPLTDVMVTATQGSAAVTAHSTPSGFFSLSLTRRMNNAKPIILTFQHAGYKTLTIIATKPGDQLYIARMELARPLPGAIPKTGQPQAKIVEINNVRVRYSLNQQSTVAVGSLAKQFLAYNVGNIPCRSRPPCSPDGKWAAKDTTLTLDAQAGNEFSNVRVRCIAGPCAFTRIDPNSFHPARQLTVSVLNWSDPTSFLIEADVTRVMATDSIQFSYPFIVGQSMNFALPSNSEGPSIEADLDGQSIVFPLGPDLLLSWGNCSMQASQNGNKIYQCQLKAGYRFAG